MYQFLRPLSLFFLLLQTIGSSIASGCTTSPTALEIGRTEQSLILTCRIPHDPSILPQTLCENAHISWYKNDAMLPGKNSKTLTFDNSVDNEGVYRCQVDNVDSPTYTLRGECYCIW